MDADAVRADVAEVMTSADQDPTREGRVAASDGAVTARSGACKETAVRGGACGT